MSRQRNHRELLSDYKQLLQFGRKLGLLGGITQFSILIFINASKHLEIPYYKFVAAILFSWCLYQFVKDFFTFLKVDRYRAQIISDGISLEKKNSSLGKFFHEVLDDFNFIKILSQRSLVNLIAFWCLGYFLSQFVVELNPSLVVSRGLLVFISGILTTIACKFYYDSHKPIAETKEATI